MTPHELADFIRWANKKWYYSLESDHWVNNDADSTSTIELAKEFIRTQVSDVTRVEVIDEKGRSYVNWKKNNMVDLSYQDGGRTLKVFISQKD